MIDFVGMRGEPEGSQCYRAHKVHSGVLTFVLSWAGGAVGGVVLLTKMPRGLLSMPDVRFMVMTMELPSNQYDMFPSGRFDTAIVLSSCPISICRVVQG